MTQVTEDAASVLESFIHDVANLPAEIAHLMEELEAKNKVLEECRNHTVSRDHVIQKHVKQHGVHSKHPSEDKWNKSVIENFDKALTLQDQKLALASKASFLLDRHVKRLDLKIKDLEADGTLQHDPSLPSMLHFSPANLVQPNSGVSTGMNTPSHPHAIPNGISSASIANAALARNKSLASSFNLADPRNMPNVAPVAGMQPHGNIVLSQRVRESSAAAENKRRRLQGGPGSLQLPSSGLARPSSLGPGTGTPKAGTPAASSRAGSAGPARVRKIGKRGTTLKKGKPLHKKAARRLAAGEKKASPSTTGDDDDDDDDGASASRDGTPDSSIRPRKRALAKDGTADEDPDDAEEGDEDQEYRDDAEDNRKYCLCNSVSFGNMVACDNDKCEFEWFHWECVGLSHEPKGRWLCPACTKLPKSELSLSR